LVIRVGANSLKITRNVTVNGTYDGQLPGWGDGELISAVVFEVLNVSVISSQAFGIPDQIAMAIGNSGTTQYTISADSLTDVTSLVQNGSISLNVLASNSDSYHLLYASYYAKSFDRSCIASSSDPQNILQNGSFVVDHFSTKGAQTTTQFLENNIFNDDSLKDLMKQVGNYLFEDSVEITSDAYWTPNFTIAFQAKHGVCIT
jgi:hypothetical protein